MPVGAVGLDILSFSGGDSHLAFPFLISCLAPNGRLATFARQWWARFTAAGSAKG